LAALAEGADVSPSIVWQIAAERARLEDDREVIRLERDAFEREKEDRAKTITDLEARLVTVSGEKADLEQRLHAREMEVKKLRWDAREISKLKEELNVLRETSSKLIL
jgi:chromosome segregation ATPase